MTRVFFCGFYYGAGQPATGLGYTDVGWQDPCVSWLVNIILIVPKAYCIRDFDFVPYVSQRVFDSLFGRPYSKQKDYTKMSSQGTGAAMPCTAPENLFANRRMESCVFILLSWLTDVTESLILSKHLRRN